MWDRAQVINQGDGSCKHCKIIHDVNTFTLAKKVARTMEELIEELRNVAIASNDGKSKLYLRKPAAKADYYAGQMARTVLWGSHRADRVHVRVHACVIARIGMRFCVFCCWCLCV